MLTAPDLVKEETPIIPFLRSTDFQPEQAARRLCAFWKLRKAVFGQRWLLRMNQTGTGALSAEDVEYMRTGYFIICQRAPRDGWLLLFKEGRLRSMPSELTGIRIAFYYATVFADEASQGHGITVLQVIERGEYPAGISMGSNSWSLLRSALPLKFKQFIIARAVEGGDLQVQLDLNQRTRLALLQASLCFPELAHLVAAMSHAETLQLLESRGCHRQMLPACLGGSFNYADVALWMIARLSIESSQSGGVASSSSSEASSNAVAASGLLERILGTSGTQIAPHTVLSSGGSGTSSNDGDVSTSLSSERGEMSAEDVRKRNAHYSRRTYYKRKLELSLLQEQVKELNSTHRSLVGENKRLKTLWEEASKIVSSLKVPEED